MTQPLSFTIISQGDTAILSFVDMSTGKSGNLPGWSELDDAVQAKIMAIINNPDSVEGDAIKAIYNAASNYKSDTVRDIRKKLNIYVAGDKVYIDNIALPGELQKLLGNVSTLEDAKSIVAFAKDLDNNPGEHCKEALVEWLIANPSLSFTQDGRILGYRAVGNDFLSNRSGYGIVNGEEIENDHLDNSPGNVLEFPRFMVDQNPNALCSIGLHVGTWKYATDYARSFFGGHNLIAVAFKASDVVSPPSDAAQEKIRVAKYTVVETVDKPYSDTIIATELA